jgi:hypothetical protein
VNSNTGDGTEESLRSAREQYAQAAHDLRRQQVAAGLHDRPGLSYASIGESRLGPNLVAYNGTVVGKTWTTSPGLFQDWYAQTEDEQLRGPYVTARAAAASLASPNSDAEPVQPKEP